MENEDLDLEKELEDEEDLLNFDLDDISDEALEEAASDSEEDIIELVNLVEKGPETGSPVQSAADAGMDLGDVPLSGLEEEGVAEEEITEDDLTGLLEEEPGEEISLDLEGEEGAEPEESEAGGEITEEELEGLLEGEPGDEISLDLDAEEGGAPEPDGAEEAITEDDFKDLLEEDPEEELSPDLEAEEEVTTDDFEDLLKDEPDEEPAIDLGPLSGDEEPLEDIVKEIAVPESVAGEEPKAPAAEEGIGISEERLEAVVSRVVQDVVERVARETMADVAEKVITEAIEALKESLETSSD